MVGHLKYHQNLAAGQYPPVASRLESLHAIPMGTHGIRYAIGQDLGASLEENACLMRQSSRRNSHPMWCKRVQPWLEQAVSLV